MTHMQPIKDRGTEALISAAGTTGSLYRLVLYVWGNFCPHNNAFTTALEDSRGCCARRCQYASGSVLQVLLSVVSLPPSPAAGNAISLLIVSICVKSTLSGHPLHAQWRPADSYCCTQGSPPSWHLRLEGSAIAVQPSWIGCFIDGLWLNVQFMVCSLRFVLCL